MSETENYVYVEKSLGITRVDSPSYKGVSLVPWK